MNLCHIIEKFRECHSFLVLKAHSKKLVDINLIGNKTGNRALTVIAVFNCVPVHPRNRIFSVPCVRVAFKFQILCRAHKMNRAFFFPHIHKFCNNFARSIFVLAVIFFVSVTLYAVNFILAHSLVFKLFLKNIKLMALYKNYIRLFVNLSLKWVSEKHFCVVNNFKFRVIGSIVPKYVKTAVTVNRTISQNLSKTCFCLCLFKNALNFRLYYLALRRGTFSPNKRCKLNGNVISYNHCNKVINNSFYYVESCLVNVRRCNTFPLPHYVIAKAFYPLLLMVSHKFSISFHQYWCPCLVVADGGSRPATMRCGCQIFLSDFTSDYLASSMIFVSSCRVLAYCKPPTI